MYTINISSIKTDISSIKKKKTTNNFSVCIKSILETAAIKQKQNKQKGSK